MPKYNIKAPAKINLFLDVIQRLENGYHELDTVMQSVSLCDDITVDTDSDKLTVTCSDDSLSGESNLAYKAAVLFGEAVGKPITCSIYIDKHIPVAAGLAGGSTDAAAVLYALNELYGHPLDTDGLYKIALKLGADVTFCVYGGSMRAGGIGQLLTPCPVLPKCKILLVFSKSKVSSKEAYEKLDADGFDPCENKLIPALYSGDIKAVASSLFNLFERIAPEVNDTKAMLTEYGAQGTVMSGSGPTVIGLFDDDAALENAVNKLNLLGIGYAVCEPISGRI